MNKYGLSFIGIVGFLFLIAHLNGRQQLSEEKQRTVTTYPVESAESDRIKLIELSEILKDKLQQLGQLSCANAKDDTSVNGGWCAKISGAGGGQHLTDSNLIQFLTKFLKGLKCSWIILIMKYKNDIVLFYIYLKYTRQTSG